MLLTLFFLIINILFREIPCSLECFLTEENKYCLSGGFDSRCDNEKEDDLLLRDIGLHMRKKEWLNVLEDSNVSLLTKIDLIKTTDILPDVIMNEDILNDWDFDIQL
jgi:hypothetical protein